MGGTDGVWTVRHGRAVREAAEAHLLRAEDINHLMLGLLENPTGAELMVAERAGRVGAVGLRNEVKYLLSAGEPEAVAALADDALRRHADLPGWLGPAHAAARFAAVWQAGGGRPHTPGRRMQVQRLCVVRPQPGVPGELRTAGTADGPLLAGWIAAFALEATGRASPDPDAVAAHHIAAGTLGLWRDGGRAVAMAAGRGFTAHGARITHVYTPPEHRRRGYAAACVAALSARLLAAGHAMCLLYSDAENPAAEALYRRVGYAPVCTAQEYWVG